MNAVQSQMEELRQDFHHQTLETQVQLQRMDARHTLWQEDAAKREKSYPISSLG
jgi:hypothetical protein